MIYDVGRVKAKVYQLTTKSKVIHKRCIDLDLKVRYEMDKEGIEAKVACIKNDGYICGLTKKLKDMYMITRNMDEASKLIELDMKTTPQGTLHKISLMSLNVEINDQSVTELAKPGEIFHSNDDENKSYKPDAWKDLISVKQLCGMTIYEDKLGTTYKQSNSHLVAASTLESAISSLVLMPVAGMHELYTSKIDDILEHVDHSDIILLVNEMLKGCGDVLYDIFRIVNDEDGLNTTDIHDRRLYHVRLLLRIAFKQLTYICRHVYANDACSMNDALTMIDDEYDTLDADAMTYSQIRGFMNKLNDVLVAESKLENQKRFQICEPMTKDMLTSDILQRFKTELEKALENQKTCRKEMSDQEWYKREYAWRYDDPLRLNFSENCILDYLSEHSLVGSEFKSYDYSSIVSTSSFSPMDYSFYRGYHVFFSRNEVIWTKDGVIKSRKFNENEILTYIQKSSQNKNQIVLQTHFLIEENDANFRFTWYICNLAKIDDESSFVVKVREYEAFRGYCLSPYLENNTLTTLEGTFETITLRIDDLSYGTVYNYICKEADYTTKTKAMMIPCTVKIVSDDGEYKTKIKSNMPEIDESEKNEQLDDADNNSYDSDAEIAALGYAMHRRMSDIFLMGPNSSSKSLYWLRHQGSQLRPVSRLDGIMLDAAFNDSDRETEESWINNLHGEYTILSKCYKSKLNWLHMHNSTALLILNLDYSGQLYSMLKNRIIICFNSDNILSSKIIKPMERFPDVDCLWNPDTRTVKIAVFGNKDETMKVQMQEFALKF